MSGKPGRRRIVAQIWAQAQCPCLLKSRQATRSGFPTSDVVLEQLSLARLRQQKMFLWKLLSEPVGQIDWLSTGLRH
jgi:hypothetical protein